jgi:O-antigen/teichoic acid export membrane protein
MSSKLRTVSWILLALVGALTLLSALASVNVAYFQRDDQIGGPDGIALSELAGDRPDVATALKARRGTAAAFGTGYALVFLLIVLIPYRRGDRWAWWAVLVGTVATAGIILLRVPLIQTHLGLGAAIPPLVVVALALLLDVGRLKRA